MDRDEYRKMDEAEGRMWWYRALHANLIAVADQAGLSPAGVALDAGCGTGGFLARLEESRPGWRIFGCDIEPAAIAMARSKSRAVTCAGSIDALPFASDRFALVVSADVLCHGAVDERAALAELYRCTAPGGTLILNLPAYAWMMSAHDRAVHTSHRYSSGTITAALRDVGFDRIVTRYWNSLLFPLMVVRRKLLARQGAVSDVMDYPRLVDMFFRTIVTVETALLRHGVTLPFGGSILIVARKP